MMGASLLVVLGVLVCTQVLGGQALPRLGIAGTPTKAGKK